MSRCRSCLIDGGRRADRAYLSSRLTSTVEAVERAAGLTLFSPQIKSTAKELCRETRCQVIVRRFDDANKKQQQQRGKGGQQGTARS